MAVQPNTDGKLHIVLDLLDDPVEIHMEVTVTSLEDYNRMKRLHPVPSDDLLGGFMFGERTLDSGARYWHTVAHSTDGKPVDLTVYEPRAADWGD